VKVSVRNVPLNTSKFGSFLLSFKQYKSCKFAGTTYCDSQLDGPKGDLPLLDGWIRKSQKTVAALISLDVDSEEGQAALKKCVETTGMNLPIFTSKSASGKLKVHLVVDACRGDLVNDRFKFKGRVYVDHAAQAKELATVIGLPHQFLDLKGSARCFLTASLAYAMENQKASCSLKELKLAYSEVKAAQMRAQLMTPEGALSKFGIEVEETPVQKELCPKLVAQVSGLVDTLVPALTEEFGPMDMDLDEKTIRLLALHLIFQVGGKVWLSSNLVKAVLNLKSNSGYYPRRKILLAFGLIKEYSGYEAHKTSRVCTLGVRAMKFVEEHLAHIEIRTCQTLEGYYNRVQENFCAGYFNTFEVYLCSFAVRTGYRFDDVLDLLSTNHSWASESRRIKRLEGVWKWACKKIG